MVTGCNPSELKSVLQHEVHPGFMREWLELSDASASETQLAMAEGPRLHLQLFNKCTRSSIEFLTERVEPASKRACDCVVLTWHKDMPFLGKAQSFMRNVPPWAVGTEAQQLDQAIDIVDAKWYGYGGNNEVVMNLPVVSAASRSERNGNFWRCDHLEAVPLGLVAYHGSGCPNNRRHLWRQVLVRDVCVFKPLVDED